MGSIFVPPEALKRSFLVGGLASLLFFFVEDQRKREKERERESYCRGLLFLRVFILRDILNKICFKKFLKNGVLAKSTQCGLLASGLAGIWGQTEKNFGKPGGGVQTCLRGIGAQSPTFSFRWRTGSH